MFNKKIVEKLIKDCNDKNMYLAICTDIKVGRGINGTEFIKFSQKKQFKRELVYGEYLKEYIKHFYFTAKCEDEYIVITDFCKYPNKTEELNTTIIPYDFITSIKFEKNIYETQDNIHYY